MPLATCLTPNWAKALALMMAFESHLIYWLGVLQVIQQIVPEPLYLLHGERVGTVTSRIQSQIRVYIRAKFAH